MAVVVTRTCTAFGIPEDALTTRRPKAIVCNIAKPNEIMAEELFKIRSSTITRDALVAVTYFIVGTVTVVQALGTLALTVDANAFV